MMRILTTWEKLDGLLTFEAFLESEVEIVAVIAQYEKDLQVNQVICWNRSIKVEVELSLKYESEVSGLQRSFEVEKREKRIHHRDH